MTLAVPVIYSPRVPAARMSVLGRVVAMLVGLACLAVLVLAAGLVPSPSGVGTHTQIGLQECEWLRKTHLPCPGCGMTTSFAWFARGNFPASFYVQPMGFVLAVLTVVGFWTGLYIALTGRAAHRLVLMMPSGYYLYPLLAFGLAAWVFKIFIHKYGIDGWH